MPDEDRVHAGSWTASSVDLDLKSRLRGHVGHLAGPEVPAGPIENTHLYHDSTLALAGWRPCKLGDGWGAVLDGPDVAALAEDPRGTPISITDSRGGSWTATITEVVSRNQQRIVVRDTGRP